MATNAKDTRELRLTPELNEELDRLARESDQTKSALLRGITELFVKKGVSWIQKPTDSGVGESRARFQVSNTLWQKAEDKTWKARISRSEAIRMIAHELISNPNLPVPHGGKHLE